MAHTSYVWLLYIIPIQLMMVESATSKEISASRTLPTLQSLHTLTWRHHQDLPLLCVNSAYNCSQITCSNSGPLLSFGYCATYDEETRLLHIASCPYYPLIDYNTTAPGYIQLPANLLQLNKYMCGPMNKKGSLCSECVDGFGPSVTSFKYKCADCSGAWYGVPLFLLLEFVPLTLFYFIILVLRMSVTSPPMPCFILYCQLITVAVDLGIYGELGLYRWVLFADNGDLRLYMKIIATFHGLFNLDFFHLLLPPFCISSQLKSIHMAFLGYISVFYPMVLIFVTWLCIKLHDHNFRPLVLLWRPFHRCFVRLQRGWNKTNDICDVFATFFILSYTKTLHLTLLLMSSKLDYVFDKSGNYTVKSKPLIDRSISYQDEEHLIFAIPSAILCFIFNILPPFLLILYPIQAFRQCLSKCHLDFISVSLFIERMHGHYRNGLNEDRDMRSFSGFYFFLIVFTYVSEVCVHRSDYFKPFFMSGTLFLIAAVTIALIRPYQKTHMNVLDSILLSIMAIIFYDLCADTSRLLILKILFLAPIAILTLRLLHSKLFKASHDFCSKLVSKNSCSCFKFTNSSKPINSFSANSVPKEQPLIPSSTVIQYGAC